MCIATVIATNAPAIAATIGGIAAMKITMTPPRKAAAKYTLKKDELIMKLAEKLPTRSDYYRK